MESNKKIDIKYTYIVHNKNIPIATFIIPNVIVNSYNVLKYLLENDGVDLNNIQIQYYNPNTKIYEDVSPNTNLENLSEIKLNLIVFENEGRPDELTLFEHRLNQIENKLNTNDLSFSSSSSKINISKSNFNLTVSNLSNFSNSVEEDENIIIDFSYIYANPLNKKDDSNKKLRDNYYYNDIKNIYNIFKSSNKKYNIEFNPIIDEDDFKNYFKKPIKVLHICCNVLIEKKNGIDKLFLCLENKGDIKLLSDGDIKNIIQKENKTNIECLILSTSNINISKCFYNAGILNVIGIENENMYPNINKKNENFIKHLYQLLINGKTILKSFKQTKNKYSYLNCILYGNGDKILFNNIEEGKIQLNSNCILNCKYDMENNIRMIGRNKNLYDAVSFFTKYNDIKIVLIYGEEGIGKEIFMKKVGCYLFERKYYKFIQFLEIYSLSHEEIISKISSLKKKINDIETVLLLIKIDYEFNNTYDFEKKLKNLFDIFDILKIKFPKYCFLFSITTPKNNNSIMDNFNKGFNLYNYEKIQLNQLIKNYRIDLFSMLNVNFCNEKISSQNENIIIKSGYPNEIYLRVCYFYIFNNKLKYKEEKLTDEFIIEQILTNNNYFINQKIFSYFIIAYKGISNKELNHLCKGNEILVLDEQFNLIIQKYFFYELKDYFYKIDNSLIKEIQPKLDKIIFNDCLKNILKLYAIILRTIVKNSDLNFDLSEEFNAGIDYGIWLSFSIEILKSLYKDFKDKDFEYMSYYEYNIKKILENYKENIKEILNYQLSDLDIKNNCSFIFDRNDIIESFEQISICLPTIIFKLEGKNKCIDIINLFSSFLDEFSESSLKLANIRLLIFKCSITKELNLLNEISKYNILNNPLIEYELILLRLKLEKNILNDSLYDKITQFFEKEKNYINLFKLNYLMGKNFQVKKCLKYFEKAIDYAKKSKNYSLIIKMNINKAEYYLLIEHFDKAQFCLNEAKDMCKNKKINSLLEEINELSIKISTAIDKEKKKCNLNFLEANQFFDNENKSICSLSNGAFYFKQNIQKKISNNIRFEIFNYDKYLKFKKILISSKILYIGSDYYDKEGNLYFEDEKGESILFPFDELCNIINSIENPQKISLVILGFLNSEKLGNKFIEKGFPNVVIIPNSINLDNLLNSNPIFIIQFKEFFYYFVVQFLSYISSFNLENAFSYSYIDFNDKLSNALNEDFTNIKLILLKSKDPNVFILDIKEDNIFNNSYYDINSYNFIEKQNTFQKIEKIQIDDTEELENLKEIEFNDDFPYNIKMFGRKKELSELIQAIEKYNYVILFGNEKTGKTKLGIEICKYFYLRKKFDKIFYLNPKKKKKKLVRKYKGSNLLIFDNAYQIVKQKNFNNILNKNIHYLFIIDKKKDEKKLFKLRDELSFDENEIKQFYLYLCYTLKINNVNIDNEIIKQKSVPNIIKLITEKKNYKYDSNNSLENYFKNKI